MKLLHVPLLLPALQLSILSAILAPNTASINGVTSAASGSVAAAAQSTLLPAAERVFSRRRRFLLLPKGGNLKFTASLSKRLLAMYPRGFNMGIEMAVYFPVFTTRADLLPKRFRPPTTTTRKPSGPTKPLLVCIPGSALCYKAKPASKPPKLRRMDERPVQWVDFGSRDNNIAGPVQFAKYGNSAGGYETTYAVSEYRTPPPRHANWTAAGDGNARWWPTQHEHAGRPLRRAFDGAADAAELDAELMGFKRMDFPDLEPHEGSWRHFHGHRDRRQLFHGLEGLSKILGLDVKSCILRTICECKQVLLPPGRSMLHDMLRVVFTIPTTHGLSDDYSRTMQSEFASCQQEFQRRCPVSLLKMFLQPRKHVKV